MADADRRFAHDSGVDGATEPLGELAEDKHLLADIGLARDRAFSEAAKPFWRA
jgi:hypothetical protein